MKGNGKISKLDLCKKLKFEKNFLIQFSFAFNEKQVEKMHPKLCSRLLAICNQFSQSLNECFGRIIINRRRHYIEVHIKRDNYQENV